VDHPDQGDLTRHPSLDDRFDPAITISPYDEDWPRKFEREAAAIQSELGGAVLRIDHVGSTAVPRLDAKPIIDIQVAVEDVRDLGAFVPGFERLGYLFAPDPDSPDLHFFAKPVERPRQFHVHVCTAGGEEEARHLAVRDFLRSRDEEAARYADRKLELAARTPCDRLAYMEAKAPYMSDLERRAIAWYVYRSV
jgi:GrpB-like predicted nucleotidyltransferase (UPF0157 family)